MTVDCEHHGKQPIVKVFIHGHWYGNCWECEILHRDTVRLAQLCISQ